MTYWIKGLIGSLGGNGTAMMRWMISIKASFIADDLSCVCKQGTLTQSELFMSRDYPGADVD